MKTAKEMYEYMKERNFGSGMTRKWAEKHFGLIENNLGSDENVLMAFMGLHNFESMTKHDSNYAYVITNKRLICAQKQLIGEKFTTVFLENLNDVSMNKGIAMASLIIDTLKEKIKVGLAKNEGHAIQDEIHAVLQRVKNKTKSQNVTSDADELIKFKQLLDAGVITQEEFDMKKSQIF